MVKTHKSKTSKAKTSKTRKTKPKTYDDCKKQIISDFGEGTKLKEVFDKIEKLETSSTNTNKNGLKLYHNFSKVSQDLLRELKRMAELKLNTTSKRKKSGISKAKKEKGTIKILKDIKGTTFEELLTLKENNTREYDLNTFKTAINYAIKGKRKPIGKYLINSDNDNLKMIEENFEKQKIKYEVKSLEEIKSYLSEKEYENDTEPDLEKAGIVYLIPKSLYKNSDGKKQFICTKSIKTKNLDSKLISTYSSLIINYLETNGFISKNKNQEEKGVVSSKDVLKVNTHKEEIEKDESDQDVLDDSDESDDSDNEDDEEDYE